MFILWTRGVMRSVSYHALFRNTFVKRVSFPKPAQAPLLFQAEKGCWPYLGEGLEMGTYKCLNMYPPAPTVYRFVNSGQWMGFVRPAYHFLSEMLAGKSSAETGKMNDQGAFVVPMCVCLCVCLCVVCVVCVCLCVVCVCACVCMHAFVCVLTSQHLWMYLVPLCVRVR